MTALETQHPEPSTPGSAGSRGLIDMVSVWFWEKFAVRTLHLLGFTVDEQGLLRDHR